MKKLKYLFSLIFVILQLLAIVPTEVYAQGTGNMPEVQETGLLNREVMDNIVNGILESHPHVPTDKFSIGYCYLDTGETYFYNENQWYYSASLYKVPLMMILAEKEYEGEIGPETSINGVPLEYAEMSVLVYSNNDYAHLVMNWVGSETDCRELYKQWSDLPEDYYSPDFANYSFFTARYMTDVMETLYYNRERFPNIIENLVQSQPDNYFHYAVSDYDIAQKYGSYDLYNHTSGIIYTGHPFVLTVMTESYGDYYELIGETAKQFTDYTLSLDKAYDTLFKNEDPEPTQFVSETPAPQGQSSGTVIIQETPAPEPMTVSGKVHYLPIVAAVLGGVAVIAVLWILSAEKRRRRKARKVRMKAAIARAEREALEQKRKSVSK